MTAQQDIEQTLELLAGLVESMDVAQHSNNILAVDTVLTLRIISDRLRAKLTQHTTSMSLDELAYYRKITQDLRVKEKRYKPGIKSDYQLRNE